MLSEWLSTGDPSELSLLTDQKVGKLGKAFLTLMI